MRYLALAACALVLSACGFIYRIDVQQGNYVAQENVAKLKAGMSRNEVRQLLGTPLLRDVFHADRWDYYFSNTSGSRSDPPSRLTVIFKDDKVVQWTGEGRTDQIKSTTTIR